MSIIRLAPLSFALLLGLAACGGGQKQNEPDPKPTVNMSESYKQGRANFKAVTGLELPELENLEVDSSYPYKEGDKEYCFDIIGGSACTFATYQIFESFFLEKCGDCDADYPNGNEEDGRDAQWTLDSGRWYQTYWDAFNKAIYINTMVKK